MYKRNIFDKYLLTFYTNVSIIIGIINSYFCIICKHRERERERERERDKYIICVYMYAHIKISKLYSLLPFLS